MAPLPPVPDVLRFDFAHTVSTDMDVLVRLWFHNNGTAPTDAVCVELAEGAQDAWNADLAALCNDDVVQTTCRVTDMTSDTAGDGSHVSSFAGTRGTAFLSGGTALLINYKIGRRYRGGKPRSYWPFGVTTDLNGPNLWSSAFTAAVATAYASFQTAMLALDSGGVSLDYQANVSYYNGFTTRPDPPIPGVRAKNISTPRTTPLIDEILSSVVNGKPASQRRRNTQKR